jgi:site-specific recombinase XerD
MSIEGLQPRQENRLFVLAPQPKWNALRHTHATHSPGRGVELTPVRHNRRHASVSTTSIYLHSNERRVAHIRRAMATHP